jgi:cell wall-associated NlpC family hydrolase
LFAPHYARPVVRSCGVRPAYVRAEGSESARPTSELLPGEAFAALEISGGWAWGYCRADHYVGYVEAIALVNPIAATHVVAALVAPILPQPDVHASALAALPMGSRLRGEERSGFLATESGFVPFTHVREVGAIEQDPAAVAERFLDAPYLLGGRTLHGIDCSGLVQLALGLCGVEAPRDSDQQRALGTELSGETRLERNDLVFFEGHVGLMFDDERLIHATGHHGKVLIEPLAIIADRTPIHQRRRL